MSTLTDVHQTTVWENLQRLLKAAWVNLELQPLEAAAMARRAEHLARRSGDNRAWAQSLFIWGVSSLVGGDGHDAIALLSRSLAVYRFLGDEQGQWSCLKAIALAWGHLGDTAQALETHSQANAFKGQAEFLREARWLRCFEGS